MSVETPNDAFCVTTGPFYCHRFYNWHSAIMSSEMKQTCLYTSQLVCCCNHRFLLMSSPSVFLACPALMKSTLWPKSSRLPILIGRNQVRSWLITKDQFIFKYSRYCFLAYHGVMSGYLNTTYQ